MIHWFLKIFSIKSLNFKKMITGFKKQTGLSAFFNDNGICLCSLLFNLIILKK